MIMWTAGRISGSTIKSHWWTAGMSLLCSLCRDNQITYTLLLWRRQGKGNARTRDSVEQYIIPKSVETSAIA